jgi:Flp pilus assembly protein TadB
MRLGPSNPPLQGVRTAVDGERMIEMLHPIPADGAALALKSALRGVHARGSGASVEVRYAVSVVVHVVVVVVVVVMLILIVVAVVVAVARCPLPSLLLCNCAGGLLPILCFC